MSFDPKVIEALARLRAHAHPIGRMDDEMRECFNTLDNAGVFAALDEQTDYESAEAILAESAVKDTAEALCDFNAAYAADRHPHDPAVCPADADAGPALHAGTCPVWAAHHHLSTAREELSRRETQSDRDAWYDMDR